jgi:hypothetical protein
MRADVPIASLLRYAERFHVADDGQHHVASPLGAWLVLALAGETTSADARKETEEALGCDIRTAAAAASTLIDHPHPLVAGAAAVWRRRDVATDAVTNWLGRLPTSVDTGDIPSPPAADRWAQESSRGQIDRFPLPLGPGVVFVLASALAATVSWHTPYTLAPAADLGADSPWAGQLRRVLRAPEHGHSGQYIAASDRAGDVAVHTARARGGLSVTSVAAAPNVAPADVLAVAHHIALGEAIGTAPARRSLFELPLGDGPAWTIREGKARAGEQREQCTAVVPAWSARTSHDLLMDRRLGFAAAASGIVSLLPPGGYAISAWQSAAARYHRIGFEAAAATATRVSASWQVNSDGLSRTADLRFAHPYAVVAVTIEEQHRAARSRARHPWHGLPVFSAWIAEPDDAV